MVRAGRDLLKTYSLFVKVKHISGRLIHQSGPMSYGRCRFHKLEKKEILLHRQNLSEPIREKRRPTGIQISDI